MSRKLLYSFFVLFTLTVFISCEKEEGQGGTSSITGKVLVKNYNDNFTVLVEPPYYATDEEVFIVYGDDVVYGDKTTTNYDGTYRFEYLREGDYTIYAYSEDSAYYPTNHEIAIMQKVTISGRKKDVKLPDIIILK